MPAQDKIMKNVLLVGASRGGVASIKIAAPYREQLYRWCRGCLSSY